MTPVEGHSIAVGWPARVPTSHATLLSLVVMSWNAEGAVAANWYSEGLMLPCEAPVYWFTNATMPANIGAEIEVPPIIEPAATALVMPVLSPGPQLLPVLTAELVSKFCVQKMNPGKFGVAKKETSGDMRVDCPATVTVCH